jgi:hypothetical protein
VSERVARSLRGRRLLFWAAIVFAFVMAILPHPPEIPGAPSDKVQHIIAFVALAGLGYWAYPRSQKRLLLVGLAAFGALIEVVQAIPALHRDSDPADFMADTLAAAAVLTAVAIWRLTRRGDQDQPNSGTVK